MDDKEHERLRAMKDHDLLVEIAVKTNALEGHSREQNGFIKDLMERALKLEGAMSLGKWILGVAVGSLAAIATIIVFMINNGS